MTYGWETSKLVGFNESRNGFSDTMFFLSDVYMVNQGKYDEINIDTLYCYNERA